MPRTEGATGATLRSLLLPAILLLCVGLPVHAGIDWSHGLLWEIRIAGAPPSYLFGTIHSEDPEVLQLDEPVRRVFDAADSVVLEVLPDMESMLYSATAMLLMDGRTLSDIIGSGLFGKTARAIRSRGISEVVLQRMKPWAAATTLSLPPPVTGLVLDMKLFEEARQAGKQLHGLESIREQLDVFDTMTERDQVALLQDAVDNLDLVGRMNDELLAAWKRHDLGGMLVISDAAMEHGDPRIARDFEQRLILERNRLMAERVESHLRQGNAFIAVGALHLPGESGLLNLLAQRGHAVRKLH